MPNHVTALLEAPTEILDFLKGDDRLVDLENVVPQPEILKGYQPHLGVVDRVKAAIGLAPDALGSESTDLNAAHARLKASNIARTLSTPCDKRDLGDLIRGIQAYKETGFVYWYDWALANWGTKWNAYDAERHSENLVKFETAWSFPKKLFETLSAMFPDKAFTVRYADEDYGYNCGTLSFINGESVFTEPSDPLKFAYDVCGVDESDFDE